MFGLKQMIATATRPTMPRTAQDTTDHVHLTAAQSLLLELLNSSLVVGEDYERLPTGDREELSLCVDSDDLLPRLVAHDLLTTYQAGRIEVGAKSGLLLGHYRILDSIGAGGMGVVYKAEHRDLRRQVAIKVLAPPSARILVCSNAFLRKSAVARLQHPNIVAAIDAGQCPAAEAEAPPLRYFVMEYIDGQNLEEQVLTNGPLSAFEACDIAYQIASALTEAQNTAWSTGILSRPTSL